MGLRGLPKRPAAVDREGGMGRAAATSCGVLVQDRRLFRERTEGGGWRARRGRRRRSAWWHGSKHSLSAQRDAGSWVQRSEGEAERGGEQAGGPDGQGCGDVDVVTWTVVAWML